MVFVGEATGFFGEEIGIIVAAFKIETGTEEGCGAGDLVSAAGFSLDDFFVGQKSA